MDNKKSELAILDIQCIQYMLFERNSERYLNRSVKRWKRQDLKSLKYNIGRMRGVEKVIRKTLKEYGMGWVEPKYIHNIIMSEYDRYKIFYC